MAAVVGRSTESLAGMNRIIGALFYPKVPRTALLGMWTMAAIWGIGVAVASSAYLVAEADPCQGIRLIWTGFNILGAGAIVGPLIAARAWRDADLRTRIFIVVFPVWGLAFIVFLATH